jgi:hypothetical protein
MRDKVEERGEEEERGGRGDATREDGAEGRRTKKMNKKKAGTMATLVKCKRQI